MANSYCDACKDETCLKTGEPCAEVEKMLPKENTGSDAGRRVNWKRYLQSAALADIPPNTVPERNAAICALYYRCGWSQERIGRAFSTYRRKVSRVIASTAKRYAQITSVGHIYGKVERGHK